MKNIFLIVLAIISQTVGFAQYDTVYNCAFEFPTLDEIDHSPTQAQLYQSIPKLLAYKDYCLQSVKGNSVVQYGDHTLSVSYGLLETNSLMKINITDLDEASFKTPMGKTTKDIKLYLFNDSNPEVWGAKTYSDLDTFSHNYIKSVRFSSLGGSDDYVGFSGYHNNRYLIEISIFDEQQRFKTPEQVKEYLKDYIEQINL
jgi:hypothetical protein